MANPADKRTAPQRIEDLERALMSMFQASNQMAQDLQNSKTAVKLLNNKLNAIQTASQNGEALSNEVISRIMLETDMKELQDKVTGLIERGILVAQEGSEEGCFIVGGEYEPGETEGTLGKVVNQRLQFSLGSLQEDLRKEFYGRKVGDILKFKDDNLVFKIDEVYKIVNPKPPVVVSTEAPEAPAALDPAQNVAAPESSSDAAAPTPAATSEQASGN